VVVNHTRANKGQTETIALPDSLIRSAITVTVYNVIISRGIQIYKCVSRQPGLTTTTKQMFSQLPLKDGKLQVKFPQSTTFLEVVFNIPLAFEQSIT